MMFVLMNFVSQNIRYPYQMRKNTCPKLSYHFFTTICLLLIFRIHAAVEIILSINSHTRNIKLPERSKVLMVHDYVNKNYGSYLKHSKYDAFTLHQGGLSQLRSYRGVLFRGRWSDN
jgi:hypothetical protein